jgi:DNA-binding transcriptional regulator LsrR (DeoR family)
MKTDYNAEGVPVDTFAPKRQTLAGPWARTMLQQYQIAGTSRERTVMYVVRHMPPGAYEGVTHVTMPGHTYELTDVQSEPVPGPRAYDLLTLLEVTKRG